MRMSKLDKFLYIYLVSLGVIAIITIWFSDITLESKYIPTILNGIVSSVSIIIGFTATAIAIMLRRTSFELPKELHLDDAIMALLFPISLILATYYSLLVDNDFQSAIRLAITSLVISFCIVSHIIIRLSRMVIDMSIRTHKDE